ncbi:DNA breaking-rejoining protein [Pantoea ananatis]|uniref:DNA breaking-rejoining protein n=1 Tax=Pantoea ananas TaxID=553 RepID=UPI001B303C3E|nr:DNA breaking-rejoining protein [Pantoea ananatis]
MADLFSRLAFQMDNVTAQRFGRPVVINNQHMYATEQAFTADLGPLSGDGLSLIIFNTTYQPYRNDRVEWQGRVWRVERWHTYNNKPQIWLEEALDAGP